MAEQALVAYANTPLTTERHIRLLQILSRPGEKTRCCLKSFHLEETPDYKCLSYTWSDPIDHALSSNVARKMTDERKKQIDLQDGSTIFITENLLDAFQELCDNDHNYLWIDAVCINQHDEVEKGKQVKMMGNIYRRAQAVIIWLGHEDDRTEGSLRVMNRLNSIDVESLSSTTIPYDIDGWQASRVLCDWSEKWGFHDLGEQEWLDFAALLHRQWFGRVWVIQESYFARKRIVLLGTYRLEWSRIVRSVQVLSRAGLHVPLKVLFLHAAWNEYSIIKMTMSLPNSRLTNLQIFENLATLSALDVDQCLHYSRFFGAKDARDHVYALLDILSPLKSGMSPAYNVPIETAFATATTIAIRNSKSLQILGLRDSSPDEKLRNLPSWVPDYSQGVKSYPLSDKFAVDGQPDHWDSSAGLELQSLVTTGSPNVLPVSGFKFDTVAETGPTFDEVDTQLDMKALFDVLDRYPGLSYEHAPDDSPCEALLRTLVKDSLPDYRDGSSPNVYDGFAAFVMQRLRELRIEFLQVEHSREGEAEGLRKQLDDTEEMITRLSSKYSEMPDLARLGDLIRTAEDEGSIEEQELDVQRQKYEQSFRIAYYGRRLFRTQKGYFGITLETMNPDDQLWILAGAKLPFVLRHSDENHYKMVGEAYVHGMMHGEAVPANVQLQQIYLV